MSRWNKSTGSRSAKTISYAERLRQANQKVGMTTANDVLEETTNDRVCNFHGDPNNSVKNVSLADRPKETINGTNRHGMPKAAKSDNLLKSHECTNVSKAAKQADKNEFGDLHQSSQVTRAESDRTDTQPTSGPRCQVQGNSAVHAKHELSKDGATTSQSASCFSHMEQLKVHGHATRSQDQSELTKARDAIAHPPVQSKMKQNKSEGRLRNDSTSQKKQNEASTTMPRSPPGSRNSSGDVELIKYRTNFQPSRQSSMNSLSSKLSDSATQGETVPKVNVWEQRIRQRQEQAAISAHNVATSENPAFTTPTSSTTSSSLNSAPTMLSDTTTVSTPTSTSAPARSSTESQTLPTLPLSDTPIEPDPSLTDPNDDTWLRRIHMLNGGPSAIRFGRFSCKSTGGTSGENESVSPDTPHIPTLPFQTPSDTSFSPGGWGSMPQVMMMNPYAMTSVFANFDGSFSSLRSADAPAIGAFGAQNAYMQPFYFSTGVDMNNMQRRNNSNGARSRNSHSGNAGLDSVSVTQCNSPADESASESDRTSDASRQRVSDRAPRSAPMFQTQSAPATPRGTVPSYPYMPFGASHVPLQFNMPYVSYAYPMAFTPSQRPYGPNAFACDPSLLGQQLQAQVEFYFSESNLASDFFLRQQMDAEGYVALETLINFKRLRVMLQATPDTPTREKNVPKRNLALLRGALEASPSLELNADQTRVRRAENWEHYVLHPEAK